MTRILFFLGGLRPPASAKALAWKQKVKKTRKRILFKKMELKKNKRFWVKKIEKFNTFTVFGRHEAAHQRKRRWTGNIKSWYNRFSILKRG